MDAYPQEVRIDDYIKAYTTTGRPPPPIPEEPADESQRKLLGLPPLFEPVPFKLNDEGVPELLAQPFTKSTEIPDAQEFTLRRIESEKYHAMSCMLEYSNFSHEVRLLYLSDWIL